MTVADEVKTYIRNKPYTKEAIDMGIVNYSALARHIQRDLGLKRYDAVKAALIRYSSEAEKSRALLEEATLPVLRHNNISMVDNIIVVVSRQKLGVDCYAEVKTEEFFIYIMKPEQLRGVPKGSLKSIPRINKDCAAIFLHSGENLEDAAGVMAFVTSLFASQRINILELISCYTETVVVVSKKDLLRSYELLSGITE